MAAECQAAALGSVDLAPGADEIMRISPHYVLPPTDSAWYRMPGEIGAWHRRVIDDLRKAGVN